MDLEEARADLEKRPKYVQHLKQMNIQYGWPSFPLRLLFAPVPRTSPYIDLERYIAQYPRHANHSSCALRTLQYRRE
jgi:hypothetical protein